MNVPLLVLPLGPSSFCPALPTHQEPTCSLSFQDVLSSSSDGQASTKPPDDQASTKPPDDQASTKPPEESAERCRSEPNKIEERPREAEPQGAAPPPAPPAERSIEAGRVVAPAGPLAPPADLQKLAGQLLRSVAVRQVGQETSLSLQVSTPRLPRLDLELQLKHGQLYARLSLPDRASHELLRASAPQLQASLEQRGLPVAALEVRLEEPSRRERTPERRKPAASQGRAQRGGRGLVI